MQLLSSVHYADSIVVVLKTPAATSNAARNTAVLPLRYPAHLADPPVGGLEELCDVLAAVVEHRDRAVAQAGGVEARHDWRRVHDVGDGQRLQRRQVPCCADAACGGQNSSRIRRRGEIGEKQLGAEGKALAKALLLCPRSMLQLTYTVYPSRAVTSFTLSVQRQQLSLTMADMLHCETDRDRVIPLDIASRSACGLAQEQARTHVKPISHAAGGVIGGAGR